MKTRTKSKKAFCVEITTEVTRSLIVHARDESEVADLVRDGDFEIDEELEGAFDIISIDEIEEEE